MRYFLFTYYYGGRERTELVQEISKPSAVVSFFKGCDLTVLVKSISETRATKPKNDFFLSKLFKHGSEKTVAIAG